MACTNCSTGAKDGTPRGCKNNGTCGTDSCNKLTVFDWLSNMSLPNGETAFDCIEVRFKNGRKEFFRNTEKLTLSIGDIVATEASPGHDIGIVTLTGELVRVQMKKKNVKLDSPDITKVYRKASQRDIDIWVEAREKEEPMKVKARELAISLKLEMKISDIEYQGDASKATFYYTANDRVDFRALIKEYAQTFKTRIEMKQVGFRQEAARLGGIGSCGRELCCSTWLTDFRSVNTSAARYQQLSLNPQKLAGQCGKLKCCLNYELDTYLDALKDFPDMETKLHTEKGDAICQKQDIFKGLMWFAYTDNFAHWHVLKIEQVKEIMAQNKEKIRATSLEDFAFEVVVEKETTFSNAMGQESLTRFDQPKKKKPSARNRNKKPKSEVDADVAPKIIISAKNNTATKPNPNAKPNNKSAQKPKLDANPDPEKKRPIIIKKNENPS
ncbi:MAG: cell fate regulator YaaT (PSP1 superfamily) [Flavobacterium sp.]|jgi:cell fate regulator YaaT (PSP1 superfamily)